MRFQCQIFLKLEICASAAVLLRSSLKFHVLTWRWHLRIVTAARFIAQLEGKDVTGSGVATSDYRCMPGMSRSMRSRCPTAAGVVTL